jgi:mono/diheme cytochrome c family protein
MMKKYTIILIILPVLLLASFSWSNHNTHAPQQAVFADTLPTPLVLYGSYIFQRDNCSSCHSLVLDTNNISVISLDGLAGRGFSNSWHYRHLQDPLSMAIGSKMPPQPRLFTNTINRAKLLQLYLQQNPMHHANDSVMVYKKLQAEVTAIVANLVSENISIPLSHPKEVIALIAYLQQIPSGPQRRYKDSIWVAAIKNREALWDNITLNDTSAIIQLANSTNKDTVAMGRQLFTEKLCYVCHGQNGGGSAGPNLTDEYWLHGSSSRAILQSIANGVPDHGMQAFKSQLSPQQIALLTAYIHALKGTQPADAKAPQGKKEQ